MQFTNTILHMSWNVAQARPMSVSYVPRSLQGWVSTTHRSYSQLTLFNIFYFKVKSKHVILRQPPQIRTRRPQRLPRGSVSRINAHESSCIFPLAFHAIMKAAEFSAVSHHPSLCVRHRRGGTSASTASRITLVKDSAISEILLGCKGRSGSLEMIRATTRCLQSSSDRNFCRSKGRIYVFFWTYASVGCNTTAEADHRVHDVVMVWILLGWRRRLGVELNIIYAGSMCVAG